jgi:CBS domain-containing protein
MAPASRAVSAPDHHPVPMNAASTQDQSCEPPLPVASGDGIVDFAAPRLRESASLLEAARLLLASGAWGVPVVDGEGHYLGTCTLRSIVAAALPVTEEGRAVGEDIATARAGAPTAARLRGALRRPVTQGLDIEVPAVRLGTRLPQLLAVLCRRSPMVPIIADSGMRLLGTASLRRSLRMLVTE